MSKIYDFKNKDIKIEFNSIKIGNSAYINQPIEVIEYIEYLQNHLQQKENKLNEVREYLQKTINRWEDYEQFYEVVEEDKYILKMLDKENK